MAEAQMQQTARVEFRMAANLKKEVEDAAELVGKTFTSFATDVLVERSRQVKQQFAKTLLDNQERDELLRLLENPPEPTDPLIRLMRTKVNL